MMSASRFSTALAACEYSHCVRSRSQLSGRVVQLFVCWLAGKVNVQKMICVPTMQRKFSSALSGKIESSRLGASASIAIAVFALRSGRMSVAGRIASQQQRQKSSVLHCGAEASRPPSGNRFLNVLVHSLTLVATTEE